MDAGLDLRQIPGVVSGPAPPLRGRLRAPAPGQRPSATRAAATSLLTRSTEPMPLEYLNSVNEHGRLIFLLSVSLQRGPSVLLLFAFEYLLLSSTIAATFVKYALYVNEARLGGRWDEKGEPPVLPAYPSAA